MFSDFMAGIGYLIKGFRLIRRPGLRRYFIGPIVINFTVITLFIWLAASQFAAITNKLLPEGSGWWGSTFYFVAWVLFGMIVVIFGFFLFTLVVNFIGAPFNGLLSGKIEKILIGGYEVKPPRKIRFFADIKRSITGEMKKYGYFLLVILILAVTTFIPVLNILVAALLTAWMLTLEYLSYPMGNHNRYFPDVRRWLRRHKMLGLGFGLAVTVATITPLINFLVMPAAVAGATALWVERRDIASGPVT